MADETLEGMIAALDKKERFEVRAFILSLTRQRNKAKHQGTKKDALKKLRNHRGVLAGEDRDRLREEAMEEKYGHIS